MSRLLIKLKSQKDYAYDNRYYHKLQGFIYELLRDSSYHELHDKKGYKFFCYSNIFPIENNYQDSVKNLLISSPNEKFTGLLHEKLEAIRSNERSVNIGEMSFKVEDISLINSRINRNCKLMTATPVIIRVPSYNYKQYGIDSSKESVYWRKEYTFEAFVKQLNDNLIKKYNEYHNADIKEIFLFEQFVFKKTSVNHVVIKGKEHKFIGSIWEFKFPNLSNEQREILQFGMDAGFGERNSFGFGFVNLMKGGD